MILKDESYHQNNYCCFFFVLFLFCFVLFFVFCKITQLAALPLLPQLLNCNAHVAVMGSGFDQRGKVVKQNLTTCGNPIPS